MSKSMEIRTNPVETEVKPHGEAPNVVQAEDEHASLYDPAQDTPEEMSRRRFLSKVSLVLTGVGGLVVVVPVVGFIIGPLLNLSSAKKEDVWRSVGPVDNYKVGETIEVKFTDASPLPWAGVVAQTAAWLRRDTDTQFTAFAINCTHLGCPVSWLPSAGLFMCPCHGGVYYSTGEVAAGPPPAHLPRYDVRTRTDEKGVNIVEIKATGTPLVQEGA